MTRRTLWIALLLIAAPAVAQMGPPGGRPGGSPQPPTGMVPPLGRDFVFEVGAWAEYTMSQGQMAMTVKYSVVGKENCDKATCYWLETEMKMPGGAMMHRVLLSGDPNDPANVKKMFVKPPGGAAIEVPVGGAKLGGTGSGTVGPPSGGAAKPPPPKFSEQGSTKMSISGKALDCKHLRATFRGMTMDAWVSKGVKLFGLVKLEAPMMTLVLKDFGTGAKTGF